MNIAEILKHCPKGTKLYSLVDGEVYLQNICNSGQYRIEVSVNDRTSTYFTEDGKLFANRPNGECVLFPSKEQRDWSKFNMNTKVNDDEEVIKSRYDNLIADKEAQLTELQNEIEKLRLDMLGNILYASLEEERRNQELADRRKVLDMWFETMRNRIEKEQGNSK